jgi:argininosuccinate lyase
MPHKKNPDVFELMRSRMNRLKALPNEIFMMTTNLPSGYHRDLQMLKEHLFPAFAELKACLEMAFLMLSRIEVKEHLLDDPNYEYLFSVEEVNRLVLGGLPFRDAYRKVGESIEQGTFEVTTTKLLHTHEGSIGNLCLPEIKARFKTVLSLFPLQKVDQALSDLVR